MSTFTSFAVAGGSGLVGQAVVAGLVAAGAREVVVLSRSAGTTLPGATTRVVDFSSADSLAFALDGTDVVISTLGGAALGQQPALARAAK